MTERSHIEGLEIATPKLAHDGPGTLVAESRWLSSSSQAKLPELGYERTVTARAGFLCEPHFDASRPGVRRLRCIHGEAFVVVVDVRRGSPTFGQCETFELSADNPQCLSMPIGLACGYQILSDSAVIDERLSHDPQDQWQWLDWREPYLQIDWPETAFTFASHRRPSTTLHEIPAERLSTFDQAADQSRETLQAHETLQSHETHQTQAEEPIFSFAAHVAAQPRSARRGEQILVLGCRGQLGKDLCRELRSLGNVVGACRGATARGRGQSVVEVDLTRPASLRSAIRDLRPTLIVNAAAMTDIDACEAFPREAQLINATAPMLVAEEARKLNIPVIHFCTSLVYGGRGNHAWRETDPVEPRSHYARTKSIGSEAVCSSQAPHLVLRTNWLYSANRTNFVDAWIDQALERDPVVAWADQYGTPTASAWLAAVTVQLLRQAPGSLADWLDVNGGVLHATPLGFTSRVEVAELVLSVCRARGLPVVARTVRTLGPGLSDPSFASAAYNCKLDCSRLSALLGQALPRWQAQLTEHLHCRFSEQSNAERLIAA